MRPTTLLGLLDKGSGFRVQDSELAVSEKLTVIMTCPPLTMLLVDTDFVVLRGLVFFRAYHLFRLLRTWLYHKYLGREERQPFLMRNERTMKLLQVVISLSICRYFLVPLLIPPDVPSYSIAFNLGCAELGPTTGLTQVHGM